ncbi:uncharacterized protein B0H64DRAFT_410851 [Chaetomium fimeti]|uniref:F-box domain-containing protein n=1 Tax=Chaetomium fimeti TaxID=1854472 RepID=A0AAE0H6H3_9PEZI|nr:hypothetical protein B0H64DRAFT_410851 [Chaetomium fimeti]
MPRQKRGKSARNRRQQTKGTRRSERLAGRGPATRDDATRTSHENVEQSISPGRRYPVPIERLLAELGGDGADATSYGDLEQAASLTHTHSTTPMERLPCELIRIIGEHLPVESRVTLALASRILMFKSGGIGPGSNNIALDENPPSQVEEDDDAYPPPTPRMMLLELLEHESQLLTRCDYCRTLHSPLSTSAHNVLRPCHQPTRCFAPPVGCWGALQITLPLIRRAVIWDRQGLEADSLLAAASCSTANPNPPDSPYRSLSTLRARVCGGSVVVRTQIFVARTAPSRPTSLPAARDLAALDDILRRASQSWVTGTKAHERPTRKYKTPKCLAKVDAASRKTIHRHTVGCYRADAGPPRSELPYKLRCMLMHNVPCRSRGCRRVGDFPGHVGGSRDCFLDHAATAIPLADPRSPWDRVLVFTSWRDLGSGDSKHDAKWAARSGYQCAWPDRNHRADHRSRVGDAYEAFEGAAEGAPYVPELSRIGANVLLSR